MGVPRMTVRSWMLAVAMSALGLAAIPVALDAIASLLDDVYQSAQGQERGRKDMACSPRHPKSSWTCLMEGYGSTQESQGGVRATVSPTALARTVRSKRQKTLSKWSMSA